jgi:hypothetical protein
LKVISGSEKRVSLKWVGVNGKATPGQVARGRRKYQRNKLSLQYTGKTSEQEIRGEAD